MTEPANRLFDALDALLERERSMLLTGQLADLPGLLSEKEALIDQLSTMDAEEALKMDGLKARALRNQELMDNALRGIRTVAERLGTMRRLRRSLDTYDQAGRKTSIVTATGHQVEKRA